MNTQIIEDILNQVNVDKNGRIMNKGKLNDMLHSEHLKAVKNCSIPDVSGCFSFAKFLDDYFTYFDNTHAGDVYTHITKYGLFSEQDIYDMWLNNR